MIARVLLITLLNILWVAIMAGTLIIPIMPEFMDDDTVNSLLGSILCDPDEKLQRVEKVNPTLGDMGIAMIPYCLNTTRETKRDVTERWLVIGLVATGVTFLLSTLAELFFAFSLIRQKVKQGVQLATAFAGQANPSTNLSDQLRQLEAAQKAGLITYDEYDQKRGEILKKL